MLVYSKKIMRFIQELEQDIKNILTYEVRLRVERSRFYNGSASYPIKVVIFSGKTTLGYFDPMFYELGFHESLMYSAKDQKLNLIRHELAHYIAFIRHGEVQQPHGTKFRATCQEMGWGEQIYQASFCLEQEQFESVNGESSLLRKIQKLMALSSSSNKHEAEQAMIKSQQLLLKHSMESTYIDEKHEEKLFLKRIMQQQKRTAKMQAVSQILQTFFVHVIYSRAEGAICLEILGESTNVEVAEYVAAVLDKELDHLWDQARRSAGLQGMRAKNSFLLGLARGYCNKVQALKKEYNDSALQALVIIEKKLEEARSMVYPRLSTAKSSARQCQHSSSLGEQMGRALNINPAIREPAKQSHALIG